MKQYTLDLTAIIQELGIDQLSEAEQKPILESIYRTLMLRLGRRLAEELSDEDFRRFQEIVESNNDNEMEELEQLRPNFMQMYQEELDAIKENIKAILPQ